MNRPSGDFAHIPGGGPAGTACRDCLHIRPTGVFDKGRCIRAAQMRRAVLAKMEPVSLGTSSCKYFEPNQSNHLTGRK